VWNRCSAAELLIVERAQEDSNLHSVIRNHVPCPLDDGRWYPLEVRPSGLPRVGQALCPELAGLAGTTRLELVTSGLTGRRSDRLSYAPSAPAQGLEPR
jgi:hypothetical protein